MKASEYYKTQPVNNVNQTWHTDGTVTIRIYKRGWKKPHQFKIKDYGKETEKILEDEEIKE